jgi:hypothetical protein
MVPPQPRLPLRRPSGARRPVGLTIAFVLGGGAGPGPADPAQGRGGLAAQVPGQALVRGFVRWSVIHDHPERRPALTALPRCRACGGGTGPRKVYLLTQQSQCPMARSAGRGRSHPDQYSEESPDRRRLRGNPASPIQPGELTASVHLAELATPLRCDHLQPEWLITITGIRSFPVRILIAGAFSWSLMTSWRLP